LRSASSPRSGRCAGASASHFGPPTAPSSTASAREQSASVSSGSGAPVASIALPPIAASRSDGLEHAHHLAHHLRPDAVAGEDDD
jgi:hypothetical protein